MIGGILLATTGITIIITGPLPSARTAENLLFTQQEQYCTSPDGKSCFPWPSAVGLNCDPPLTLSTTPCLTPAPTPTPTPTPPPAPRVRRHLNPQGP